MKHRTLLIIVLAAGVIGSSPAQTRSSGERSGGRERSQSGRAADPVRRPGGERKVRRGIDPRKLPARVPRLPEATSTEPGQRSRSDVRGRGYDKVFSSVQEGFSTGSVGLFSNHMAPQVYVNLRDGESGYYSASQAYYLLDNYFKTRRLVNFNFTTIGESDTNPYATGSAGFNFRGSREYVQVYVSLSRSGERWVITQINIY
jgi:hypothetical protein